MWRYRYQRNPLSSPGFGGGGLEGGGPDFFGGSGEDLLGCSESALAFVLAVRFGLIRELVGVVSGGVGGGRLGGVGSNVDEKVCNRSSEELEWFAGKNCDGLLVVSVSRGGTPGLRAMVDRARAGGVEACRSMFILTCCALPILVAGGCREPKEEEEEDDVDDRTEHVSSLSLPESSLSCGFLLEFSCAFLSCTGPALSFACLASPGTAAAAAAAAETGVEVTAVSSCLRAAEAPPSIFFGTGS